MAVMEVDLIRFTTGPRQGEYGVMTDYKNDITIYSLWDEERLIDWDVSDFHLEPEEWSDEMRALDQWLNTNQWEFIYPPTQRIKKKVMEYVKQLREICAVDAFAHAPKPPAYRIIVTGAVVLLADLMMGLMRRQRND